MPRYSSKPISIDPNSIEAHEAIAEFYLTSQQLEKAETVFEISSRFRKTAPRAGLNSPDFYASRPPEEGVDDVLNQIIADSPEYVLARYKVGQLISNARTSRDD